MANDNYMKKILDSCEIYYEDSLISRESIMRQYISFFSNVSTQTENKVSFVLHTGSICFNVVSIVAVALGCLGDFEKLFQTKASTSLFDTKEVKVRKRGAVK